MYDSNYTTFWKMQNYEDRLRLVTARGWELG